MLAAMNGADPFGHFASVRFGSPGEIAETVAFLVPDGAVYTTGQHITVAGGRRPDGGAVGRGTARRSRHALPSSSPP